MALEVLHSRSRSFVVVEVSPVPTQKTQLLCVRIYLVDTKRLGPNRSVKNHYVVTLDRASPLGMSLLNLELSRMHKVIFPLSFLDPSSHSHVFILGQCG